MEETDREKAERLEKEKQALVDGMKEWLTRPSLGAQPITKTQIKMLLEKAGVK